LELRGDDTSHTFYRLEDDDQGATFEEFWSKTGQNRDVENISDINLYDYRHFF